MTIKLVCEIENTYLGIQKQSKTWVETLEEARKYYEYEGNSKNKIILKIEKFSAGF